MVQPFDPLDLMDFAAALAKHDHREVAFRTAVNRTYYALFLMARKKVKVRSKKKSVHKQVIEEVKVRHWATGDKMGKLFRLRTVADYQLIPERLVDRDWSKNWGDTEKIANDVLKILESW